MCKLRKKFVFCFTSAKNNINDYELNESMSVSYATKLARQQSRSKLMSQFSYMTFHC